ncbi:hypothetical protein ACOME3_004029 [Neoechinorhynchus agilis]
MGRKYLRYLNASKIYVCQKCFAHLAKKRDIVSTRFTGSTGRAYLFKRVYNTMSGPMQERVMLTGRHLVRDVFCIDCEEKVGWEYEYAVEDSQRYKEKKVILERALIKDEEQPELRYEPDSDSDSDDESTLNE